MRRHLATIAIVLAIGAIVLCTALAIAGSLAGGVGM